MKRRHTKIVTTLIILFTLIGLFGTHSVSEAKGPSLSTKTVTVPAGKTVDNFFAIGQNAVINGTVRNMVLVVGGNLTIHSTARIDELIVVIGGSVTEDKGSHATENIFSFAWNKRVLDAFLFGGVILLSTSLAKLIVALILILFSTLSGQLIPESFIKQSLFGSWKLWLTGLIAGIWILILIGILSVTIIGIPIAIVLLVLPFISFLILTGQMSRELGQRLIPERQPTWLTTVLGAFFLSSVLGFPLIGLLFYFGVMVLSLGHLILWVTEHWQGRKDRSM